MIYRLIHADVMDGLRQLADASIDAVVTDPPYHLTTGKNGGSGEASENLNSPAGRSRATTGFMGMKWDGGGIAHDPAMWAECLRVLKPGAHLIAFGGSRTYHRMACAIEDAGFEIRDQLQWIYGSGFPKSLDVSKAIDKAAGVERKVIGSKRVTRVLDAETLRRDNYTVGVEARGGEIDITAPATDAARKWEGYGTALKPSHEPCVLARKRFTGTVASNVLQHGTGALNIDGCRVEINDAGGHWSRGTDAGDKRERPSTDYALSGGERNALGRWPANVLLDEEAAALLDEQSGERPGGMFSGHRNQPKTLNAYGSFAMRDEDPVTYGDSGGASRFFYTAKAAQSEREEGMYGAEREYEHSGPRGHAANGDGTPRPRPRQNNHPTVKPIDLMQWLVRLVTPRGGTVLDPFMGSGSTGMAALAEGFDFVGIEREAEYIEIARRRIASVAPLLAREVDAKL